MEQTKKVCAAQAREEGKVAKSAEFTSTLVLLAGIAASKQDELRADHFSAWLTDPWWLVEQFAAELSGVIVTDPDLPATANIATTMAGIENAMKCSW